MIKKNRQINLTKDIEKPVQNTCNIYVTKTWYDIEIYYVVYEYFIISLLWVISLH